MIDAVLPTYNRAPIAFERGEGAWAITADGTRYLDLGAGIAVNALGHANPDLIAALTDQAAKVWHVSNLYVIPAQERLARMLVDRTFADTVFFTNSGAEAVESGIKVVRKWGYEVKGVAADRARIIVAAEGFHGRTTTIVGFSTDPDARGGFGPFTPGFHVVPYGDLTALREAVTPDTVAVLVEPIQGEQGVVIPPESYLPGLRALCTEHDVLLVADEIQSGLGRTGTTLASEVWGVKPDLVTLGKALGGGLYPVSAVAADRVRSW